MTQNAAKMGHEKRRPGMDPETPRQYPEPVSERSTTVKDSSAASPVLYYQDESADASIVTDLAAGTAAEHLVCADLLLGGRQAFLADQNCAYDVAVDADGRLIRVQVKATRMQRAIPQRAVHIAAYMWHVRRAGKGGRRVYASDEFDLLALVALDIGRIAYLAPSQHAQTVHIRPPGAPGGKQFDDYPFARALRGVV